MISVIIPLYNVEEYILECLQSFENQTYRNFELIIVNDGSTDNSRMLVEKYMNTSSIDIKLINQANLGVSAARNKGILEANGEFICFVDSDDTVVNYYLEKLICTLTKTKSDLVICKMKTVENSYTDCTEVYTSHKDSFYIMDTDEALINFLYKKYICGMGTFIIRKTILIENNLCFSESYRYSEDQEMIWKMINHSRKIVLIKNTLYMYRIRPNSAMSLVDNKRIDGLKLMLNLEEYFHRYNPIFFKEFEKYGVAKWVWSTVWQHAIVAGNYSSFHYEIKKYNPKVNMKKLLTYPNFKVKISSFLFVVNSQMYYLLIKIFAYRNRGIRNLNS